MSNEFTTYHVTVSLPKSRIWKGGAKQTSPYLETLVNGFFEFLQDEIDSFGYELDTVRMSPSSIVVEYYEHKDNKPSRIIDHADIKAYWEDYLDLHIQDTAHYEAQTLHVISQLQRNILQRRKSIKEHQELVRLCNADSGE